MTKQRSRPVLQVQPQQLVHVMEKGKWYRIRHRTPPQQKDRKSEMQYLGVVSFAVNVVHEFNARPTAGTQTIADRYIISVEEIERPARPFVSARW